MKTRKNLPPALCCSEIGVVHSLGKAGIPVHSGSFFNDNPALFSKYVVKKVHFDDYTSEHFIDELIEYGKQQKSKAVFISDDDRAILMFSEHREKLEPYFHFLYPEKHLVQGLLDKRKFCSLSREYHLPSPISYFFSNEKEFHAVKDKVPFPCIIKPAFKQDWWVPGFTEKVGDYKKAYVCHSLKELEDFFDSVKELSDRAIIQEYIPGDDARLYSLNMYINDQEDIKAIYIAQKKRVYPIGAGTGCYVQTVEEKDIIDQTSGMVKNLHLKGLVNVQYKVHEETNKPYIMEMHVRNSFWNYLGTAAGMNLPALYYSDLTGETVNVNAPTKPDSYKRNVAFIDLGKDIKAFLQYKKAGEMTFRQWIRTYSGEHVIGGNMLKDPLPIVKNIQFILNRRLKSKFKKKVPSDIIPEGHDFNTQPIQSAH